MKDVAVIGGGAWGTALAAVARRGGARVRLWAREPEVVAAINEAHCNTVFLPGVALDPGIEALGSLSAAASAELVLLVTPAQHTGAVCAELAPALEPETPIVICGKGIEIASGRLLSEVVAEHCPRNPIAVLSGPTFAIEIARGLPTALTLACADDALGARLAAALGSTSFRPYLTGDLVGAQVGGAVKNVLAIACGIVEGRGLGRNARAALIARGFAEMMRLGRAMGAEAETLTGLAGMGDLVLTCTSTQSRNFSFGVALGEGRSAAEILGARKEVTEGAASAGPVLARAAGLGVEMPICAAVDRIANQGASIDQVIESLLSRPFKREGA